ncbi:hypothetical protein PR048_024002 [Dryococelus australis]|uniref:Uncharacterized protein n=1 Tax=Dryococelus australis TaxID=614101 RepID=A0ABQ9GVP8_9NEOP|nr:hypothetical protein PR048_024002 [Dryococelus australis]
MYYISCGHVSILDGVLWVGGKELVVSTWKDLSFLMSCPVVSSREIFITVRCQGKLVICLFLIEPAEQDGIVPGSAIVSGLTGQRPGHPPSSSTATSVAPGKGLLHAKSPDSCADVSWRVMRLPCRATPRDFTVDCRPSRLAPLVDSRFALSRTTRNSPFHFPLPHAARLVVGLINVEFACGHAVAKRVRWLFGWEGGGRGAKGGGRHMRNAGHPWSVRNVRLEDTSAHRPRALHVTTPKGVSHSTVCDVLRTRTRNLVVTRLTPFTLRLAPGFYHGESCRTIPLVGVFSRRSPVSPPWISALPHTHPRFTIIGSQDLDVKNSLDLFTRSFTLRPLSLITIMLLSVGSRMNGTEPANELKSRKSAPTPRQRRGIDDELFRPANTALPIGTEQKASHAPFLGFNQRVATLAQIRKLPRTTTALLACAWMLWILLRREKQTCSCQEQPGSQLTQCSCQEQPGSQLTQTVYTPHAEATNDSIQGEAANRERVWNTAAQFVNVRKYSSAVFLYRPPTKEIERRRLRTYSAVWLAHKAKPEHWRTRRSFPPSRCQLGPTTIGRTLVEARALPPPPLAGQLEPSSIGRTLMEARAFPPSRCQLGPSTIGRTLGFPPSRCQLGSSNIGRTLVEATPFPPFHFKLGHSTIGRTLVEARNFRPSHYQLGPSTIGRTLVEARAFHLYRIQLRLSTIGRKLVEARAFPPSRCQLGPSTIGSSLVEGRAFPPSRC